MRQWRCDVKKWLIQRAHTLGRVRTTFQGYTMAFTLLHLQSVWRFGAPGESIQPQGHHVLQIIFHGVIASQPYMAAFKVNQDLPSSQIQPQGLLDLLQNALWWWKLYLFSDHTAWLAALGLNFEHSLASQVECLVFIVPLLVQPPWEPALPRSRTREFQTEWQSKVSEAELSSGFEKKEARVAGTQWRQEGPWEGVVQRERKESERAAGPRRRALSEELLF